MELDRPALLIRREEYPFQFVQLRARREMLKRIGMNKIHGNLSLANLKRHRNTTPMNNTQFH
jgi:hypothetical protein